MSAPFCTASFAIATLCTWQTISAPADFPNHAALVKRLGRDGSKETTLDVEAFRERRGIGGLVDRVVERVKNLEIPQRIADVVETIRSKVTNSQVARLRTVDPNKPFRDALERYAVAYIDVARMGNKPATYQTARLENAIRSVERLQPGAIATLRSAMEHDPQALAAMTLKGPKCADGLIVAIVREQAALLDPTVRAQRFVRRWLQQQPAYVNMHGGYRRIEERKVVERKLHGLAEELAADKPMAVAIHENPTRFGLELHMPLASELRTDDPVRVLKIGIEQGFAAPSRGFSR